MFWHQIQEEFLENFSDNPKFKGRGLPSVPRPKCHRTQVDAAPCLLPLVVILPLCIYRWDASGDVTAALELHLQRGICFDGQTLRNRKGFNERIFHRAQPTASFCQWIYYARRLFIRWITTSLGIIISEVDFWENATSRTKITFLSVRYYRQN